MDVNDEIVKNRIAKVYYDYGIDKYNDKDYQVRKKVFKEFI
jgi:hypothetical protein